MAAVKHGGDRQQVHEIIRKASMEATAQMKNGERWDLIAALAAEPAFGMTEEEIKSHMEPSQYIGRCPEQVHAFTAKCRALCKKRRELRRGNLALKQFLTAYWFSCNIYFVAYGRIQLLQLPPGLDGGCFCAFGRVFAEGRIVWNRYERKTKWARCRLESFLPTWRFP